MATMTTSVMVLMSCLALTLSSECNNPDACYEETSLIQRGVQVHDSAGPKDKIKDKIDGLKDKIKDKMEDVTDKIKTKVKNGKKKDTEIIHDILFPNDTIIPSTGKTFCIYNKLPEDEMYHAIEFGWTKSSLPSHVLSMMFTISDQAVLALRLFGYDITKPMDCDDAMPLMIAMNAGGYMLFQQGGEEVHLNKDWGFLVGKGTARRHALVRWAFVQSSDGEDHTDGGHGFHIKLTTELRKVNVGEAKFATMQDGANSLSIPPNTPSFTNIASCSKQGTDDVFRGSGVQLLQVKALGNYMYKTRVLEAKGGGEYKQGEFSEPIADYEVCSLPHHASQLLEEGDFKEILSLDVPNSDWIEIKDEVTIVNGNSYRVECIYNTTGVETTVIDGMGSEDTSACQFHFYYIEKPGDNEPFPGYCMDKGPWFMRTTKNGDEAQRLEEWRGEAPEERGKYSQMYGCPKKAEGEQ